MSHVGCWTLSVGCSSLVARPQLNDATLLLALNPAPGASAPTGGVTYTGLDMRVVNPIVAFRGFPLDTVLAFDELRIGPTYASVAPLVPEPASAPLAASAAVGALLRRRRP
jgi:hypothetical protein